MGEPSTDGLASSELAAYVKAHSSAVVAAAVEQLASDPDMAAIARRRRLNEADHAAQVASFWLEAVVSDLMLGSPVALEKNLAWSLRLSEGHSLDLQPALYRRCFEAVLAGISSLPLRDDLAVAAAEYGDKARAVVASVVGE